MEWKRIIIGENSTGLSASASESEDRILNWNHEIGSN
jgi:hypothetical protein